MVGHLPFIKKRQKDILEKVSKDFQRLMNLILSKNLHLNKEQQFFFNQLLIPTMELKDSLKKIVLKGFLFMEVML